MQVASFDAPHSAPGTEAETNLCDRKTLQQFIITNSAELTDICHEVGTAGNNPLVTFTTPDAIFCKLFDNLHRYGGPPVEADFMTWARRFVSREVDRYVITGRILTEYETLIFSAIQESMWESSQDWAIEPKDFFWEIIYLIFQRAHSLDKPGKAKLSTRLYALVRKHIKFYYNHKNRKRRNAVQLRRNEIRCEHLSEEELAAMKAAEADDAAPYDPGYHELGLSMV
jgi:hypothetical protein